jgi:hypothetical protein
VKAMPWPPTPSGYSTIVQVLPFASSSVQRRTTSACFTMASSVAENMMTGGRPAMARPEFWPAIPMAPSTGAAGALGCERSRGG